MNSYDSDSYASDYLPEKSIYQDDGRMFHRGGYQYETVESASGAAMDDGALTLDLALIGGSRAKLAVVPLADTALRVQVSKGGAVFDETSAMVPALPSQRPKCRLTERKGSVALAWAGRTLEVALKPFTMRVLDSNGAVVLELETEKIAGKHICPPLGFRTNPRESCPYLSWKLDIDSRYFGLGEKFGKVEKTGTRSTIWSSDTCGSNTTDMSYKAVPVLFSTAGWGMMLHSSYRSFWEIGTFSHTAGSFLTQDPKLDLFLFFGSSLKDLLAAYTGLTGRPSMPPTWAMGLWMSRCQYMNRAEVDTVLARIRAERIPCDVVHLDPLWMKTHWYYAIGVDACDFVRNDEGFPDQPAMFKAFTDQGFNTDLWVNPYIPEGGATYAEAASQGYLLKSTKGGWARLEHGNPVGMVDFTNPDAREWWKEHLRCQLRDGASVFKPDYGDRVPEDALFHNGRTGRELHNLYLHLFSECAYEAAREVRGEGIVWRRAGYIGTQRYPGTWAGDTQASWKGMRGCLRGGLSAGLTGEPFWSHDMGGFTGPKPSPELYIRWSQFGLLSPLSRFHGTTPREPWEYGDTALAVVKHYTKLRYSLMPYLLACAQQACDTGVAILRHLALEFPREPNVDTLDDQYMLGDSLLVAPVIGDGTRSRPVYFPAGTWCALEREGSVVEGPGFATVPAPLNRIPVFVRGGALVPRYIHNPQHLKGPVPRRIRLDVYPGKQGSVQFTDRGVSLRASARRTSSGLRLRIDPAPFEVVVNLKSMRARRPAARSGVRSWESNARGTSFTVDAAKGVSLTL